MSRSVRGGIGAVIATFALNAAPAHAACAWVLWQYQEYSPVPIPTDMGEWPSRTWAVLSAGDTRNACESDLSKAWREAVQFLRDAQPPAKVTSSPGEVYLDYERGGYTHTRYSCLPDTIDPRAPKGDRR